MDKLAAIEAEYTKKEIPVFKVGDTLKLTIRVQEGDKSTLHPFEGVVICRTGSGVRSSFTLRKISFGEGVERTFPLYSPLLEKMQVVSKGKVKRAKLYYLRGKIGKDSKVEREG
ncbi:MAG: 50S ribosomal protein L19 [Candidatus Omnitrophota bacterium]|nr:50S ribosomal protein L19 [Candidatus Omnitrophota bacterium]